MTQLSVFNFEEKDVRVLNIDGEPWFVAKDLCKILEIKNNRDAMEKLREYEKNTVALNDGTPGNPNITIISESGMYRLVMRSRKPQAELFQDWVVKDVIPSIRKTGKYELEQKPLSSAELILAQAQQLVLHEQKIKELEIEQKRQAEELKLIRESEEATAELAEANADELSRFKNGHGYWHSVVGYCSTKQIKDFSTKQAAVWGRKATALCKKSGITPEKVNDAKYGTVNVYPDHILDEIIIMF